MTIDEAINIFELRRKLIIPDDLKKYFRLTNQEIKEYEQDMFCFYKFDEFKTVKEDVGNFGGVPDYRKIVKVLPGHENCFVFVNYFITLAVFAIKLYEQKSDINEIYSIIGGEYKLVANSFTEFIKLYRYGMNNGDFTKILV